MEAYQERVVDERNELIQKHTRLKLFITENETFASLPEDEQKRLHRQSDIMLQYLEVLDARITAFAAAI